MEPVQGSAGRSALDGVGNVKLRPWVRLLGGRTLKLERGEVGVAEDEHLSFLEGQSVPWCEHLLNLPIPSRWPSSASWAARKSQR